MRRRPLSPRHPGSMGVPVVGLGTSGNLDPDVPGHAPSVITAALDAGSALFDSSPMYGPAERLLGQSLTGRRHDAVVATKVWSPSDDEAAAQMAASLRLFDGHVELMQVHNMVAWPKRLDQIDARRSDGAIDLVGATHWKPDGFADLEAAMRTGRIDTIQVPYNPIERDVEARILPLAADLGIGVLVMRPFADGDLFARTVAPGALAGLAGLAEQGIDTVADALLAWALAHPAVTAAIPATSRPDRARTNAAAGDLAIDTDTRERIARWFT